MSPAVSVRLACGVASDGREMAKVDQLLGQMGEMYGVPIRPGTVWVGDKVEEILSEIAAEMGTPPAGIEQIRAIWNDQRRSIRHPNLVVVTAWYEPVGLEPGELEVRAVPTPGRPMPRSDA